MKPTIRINQFKGGCNVTKTDFHIYGIVKYINTLNNWCRKQKRMKNETL